MFKRMVETLYTTYVNIKFFNFLQEPVGLLMKMHCALCEVRTEMLNVI